MAHFDLCALAAEPARDLHQAAEVSRKDGTRLGIETIVQLDVENRTGNVRVLHRECATEPATYLALGKLDEGKPGDACQQSPGCIPDVKLAQGRA